jgi:GNAT superfamily N-acetyltransferase
LSPDAGPELRIVPLSPEAYAGDVLPYSAALWAGERTFDEYVGEFRELCASGFGRRRFRTLGLEVDGVLAASCKRYQRELRCGERTFRAAGIGAVFTPPDRRGRGYATALLGALLDAERDAGTDMAFLFADIHPAFYERLGFVALPSRAIALRADTLPATRIAVRVLGEGDWPAMARCFAALDERRAFALTRPPLVWEWLRLRDRSREQQGTVVRLGVGRGRGLGAYVSGRRFPAVDTFVLDEFAFVDDDAAATIPALIRSAAGDLRKVAGWLPPTPARKALPRGAVRARTTAVAMIAALSAPARAAWRGHAAEVTGGAADAYWSGDHV